MSFPDSYEHEHKMLLWIGATVSFACEICFCCVCLNIFYYHNFMCFGIDMVIGELGGNWYGYGIGVVVD